jgi:hypothetical protein
MSAKKRPREPAAPAAPAAATAAGGGGSGKRQKARRRVHAKRYQWSNALHVRFLLAMCDWAVAHANPEKLLLYMGCMGAPPASPGAPGLSPPGAAPGAPRALDTAPARALLDARALARHLADYAARSKAQRAKLVALCDSMVRKDYAANGVFRPPMKKDGHRAAAGGSGQTLALSFTDWPVTYLPVPPLPPPPPPRSPLAGTKAGKGERLVANKKRVRKTAAAGPQGELYAADAVVASASAASANGANGAGSSTFHLPNDYNAGADAAAVAGDAASPVWYAAGLQESIRNTEIEMQRFTALHRTMADRHEMQMQRYGGINIAEAAAAATTAAAAAGAASSAVGPGLSLQRRPSLSLHHTPLVTGLDGGRPFSFSNPESPALSGFSPLGAGSGAAVGRRWRGGSLQFLDLDQDLVATGRLRSDSLTSSGSFSVSNREDGGDGGAAGHDDLFDFLFDD